MNTDSAQPECQIKYIQIIADGPQETITIKKSLRLFVRKKLGPQKVRGFKIYANDFLNWYAKYRNKPTKPPTQPPPVSNYLKAGDQVRVLSKKEIVATLNHWGQLRGCSFAPEMAQYCESTQKVLKSVERFIDERDFRARKTKGIVLLEGIICQGTASLGRCDRCCYYFWREEWLEKIPAQDSAIHPVYHNS